MTENLRPETGKKLPEKKKSVATDGMYLGPTPQAKQGAKKVCPTCGRPL